MRKRFLAAILCTGIVMSTLVGCKAGNKGNNEQSTVANQTEETSSNVTSENDATKDAATGIDASNINFFTIVLSSFFLISVIVLTRI